MTSYEFGSYEASYEVIWLSYDFLRGEIHYGIFEFEVEMWNTPYVFKGKFFFFSSQKFTNLSGFVIVHSVLTLLKQFYLKMPFKQVKMCYYLFFEKYGFEYRWLFGSREGIYGKCKQCKARIQWAKKLLESHKTKTLHKTYLFTQNCAQLDKNDYTNEDGPVISGIERENN